MARITVEDCLRKIDNRFAIIHLAAKRVRQLKKDEEPLVVCKNKNIVTALREIAAGKVFSRKSEEDSSLIESTDESSNNSVPEEQPDQTSEESLHQDQTDHGTTIEDK